MAPPHIVVHRFEEFFFFPRVVRVV
jgi:hypothetical protein